LIRYEFAPGRARYMLMSCVYQTNTCELLQTLLGLMRMVLQNSLTTCVINMASPLMQRRTRTIQVRRPCQCDFLTFQTKKTIRFE
jgi:hypothetical protein